MAITINRIKTGKGPTGGTVALIYAPENATPGSLVELTRFLNEQPDIRAVPGYHGPKRHHVLRVTGLRDTAHLEALLHRQLPAWQREQPVPGTGIRVADPISYEKLDAISHFPFASPMRRFVKENANTLAGLSYMAGSVGLFLFGMRNRHVPLPHNLKHDWFTLYSSVAYGTSSALLIAFARETDNPRDIYSIMREVYPKLAEATPEQQEAVENNASQVTTFLRNYPWEIASMFNATGSASHLYSAAARGRKMEGLGAFGTLTATLIAALVPERQGRSLLDMAPLFGYSPRDGALIDTLEDLQKDYPSFSPLIKGAGKLADWVHDDPLGISAGIQSVANASYGVSALTRSQPRIDLAMMSGLWLTGNYMQSQATKGRGPGFDDVVTAASNIIMNDPSMKHADAATVKNRIERFADKLVDEKEIVHRKDDMVAGISSRIKRSQMAKSFEDDVLTGFLPGEAMLLRKSPFVLPHVVEQNICRVRGDGQTLQCHIP